MTVLRVYDPAECDAAGVPFDWERCRACRGSASHDSMLIVTDCEVCDGHGSLKAAALAAVEARRLRDEGPGTVRCEDCGHPMSDGTWENREPLTIERTMAYVIPALREGHPNPTAGGVHYSPCDEACRHGGPMVLRGYSRKDGSDLDVDLLGPSNGIALDAIRDGECVEASWRPVDVRPLGWPHDLRPEKLAVLCLRCWVSRLS